MRGDDARRARLILMLADGASYLDIRHALGRNANYVIRWKGRFEKERLAGLFSCHGGGAHLQLTPAPEGRILAKTRQSPPDGSTHWTTRKLGRALNVSHTLVPRPGAAPGSSRIGSRGNMASDDPDFESKAAEVIGLYVDPLQHAAVFCVVEKTAIQALDRLDRLDPVLPLSPGRIERHGFEYYRHGTLSLYAALNAKTGQVLGKTAARHSSEAFVAFLSDIIASLPPGQETHVVADNLSAHKSQRVRDFLGDCQNLHLHFTPTYSS